jgi:hypothetical protein
MRWLPLLTLSGCIYRGSAVDIDRADFDARPDGTWSSP